MSIKKVVIQINLLVLGIIMMAYTGFTLVTKEKVVDLGPIEISKEKKNPIQWGPIVGAVLLVGGIIVLSRTNLILKVSDLFI